MMRASIMSESDYLTFKKLCKELFCGPNVQELYNLTVEIFKPTILVLQDIQISTCKQTIWRFPN